jgi:hypothetical protein
MGGKVIFLCVFVSTLSIEICAQNSSLWSIGLEAGINYCNSSEDTAPLKKECPVLPKIGISVEYDLANNFYLQSGTTYSMKGLKSKGKTEYINASVELKQYLIQLPFLLTYKLPIGKTKGSIGFSAGAYAAYGIGGKTKAIGQVNGQNINIEVSTFDKLLKRHDFGSLLKLSYQQNKISFSLSYEHGLADVGKSNVLGDPLDYKNRVSALSINYIFSSL